LTIVGPYLALPLKPDFNFGVVRLTPARRALLIYIGLSDRSMGDMADCNFAP